MERQQKIMLNFDKNIASYQFFPTKLHYTLFLSFVMFMNKDFMREFQLYLFSNPLKMVSFFWMTFYKNSLRISHKIIF